MAQRYLPEGRAGADVQRILSETGEMLDAGTGNQIGEAMAYVVKYRALIKRRNAAMEAASRVYAANNFR